MGRMKPAVITGEGFGPCDAWGDEPSRGELLCALPQGHAEDHYDDNEQVEWQHAEPKDGAA
jgi:hypothetical protein